MRQKVWPSWTWGKLRELLAIVKVDGAWKRRRRRGTWRAAIAWHIWWHSNAYACQGGPRCYSGPRTNGVACDLEGLIIDLKALWLSIHTHGLTSCSARTASSY
ncbi:hypothetical protein BVRB_9g214080 [Beta vulgaris subsp. vulgaris]|nr:hypothetical protein BVRB_9g214080 [Beta vulgaris subsp. vulgaris]